LEFSRDGKMLGAWLSRWDGASDFWVLPYPSGAPRRAFSLGHGTYPFSWMPDNRNVVFGGDLPGAVGGDLFMADTRTAGIRQVSVITRDANQPSVSPDGKTIAFQAAEDDFDIVSVPLDGSAPQTLLKTRRDEFDPMWSPVAPEQLVYVNNPTGTPQIWLRSMREGWERPLVTGKDFGVDWIAEFRDPNFSPDGQRIAYTVTAGTGHSIYVSAVAGGKPLRVSPASSDELSPTWNGDGAWIAFLQNSSGHWSLVKAHSGGGDKPVLIREHCLPVHPKWNHVTNRIAVVTDQGLTLVSDDGSSSEVVSAAHWLIFGWSNDHKVLYGIKEDDAGHRVVASLDPEKRIEKDIGDLQLPADASVRAFSMNADGKTFATSFSRPGGDIWIIRGFEKPGILERLP